MPDLPHCPECGAVLTPGQARAICPRCALKGALELTEEDTVTMTPLVNAPEAGERIGRYRLLEKIGEGGCGVVYMAEQEEPVRRRVALKVIKLGMDTKEVIARFEAERQALALMDHPHIARIFDGGATESGRPYFVMELVRGLRITDYCDQKNLSTRQRLDLFMQVCQAVQHAHQKGIIHRDLKPSNILVTVNDGVPVPKVIDFGIAKATGQRLTDKTLFTKFQQLVGTPAYMSPEQAEMTSLDIDTRSDIYSLGVLLYELLTGRTPFDGRELVRAGMDEMLRTIREQEPLRPSARLNTLTGIERTTVAQQRQTDAPKLINLIRGDLDWIVMRCLEKDRARRYETANGLARDLQRHLAQEPVVARPPATSYRVQKFVRRNRGLVTAASMIALVFSLGFVVSLWQWRIAEVARGGEALQRKEAEARAKAERMAKEDARQQRANAERVAEQAKANAAAAVKANAEAQKEKSLAEAARQDAEQEVRRRLETLAQMQIQTAEDFLSVDDLPRAVAHLASVSANNPSNRLASERLLSALTYRNFNRPLTESLRHGRRVHSAQFSPDGLRVVTASEDNTARVWDARSGRPLSDPLRHERSVHSAQFSPDGLWVVTASEDGTARVWDAMTGKPLAEPLRHKRSVHSTQFGPDGLRVVTASEDSTARVWDAQSGKPLTEPLRHERKVRSAQFSPDGLRVVTTSEDNTARIWDAMTGKPLTDLLRREPRVGSPQYGEPSVHFAQFSPNGLQVVTASNDRSVRVWDAQTGMPLTEPLWHQTSVHSVQFSPDGSRVVTACYDPVARVWDVQTGRLLTDQLRHERNVHSAKFSPDGLRVVTASEDNTARVWDAQSGKLLTEPFRHERTVRSAQFSPDGLRVVTASDDSTARVWDAQSGIPLPTLLRHEERVRSARFSPDGLRVVTAYGQEARVWDAQSGKPLTKPLRHPDSVVSAQFSPDGRLVATTSEKLVQVWEAQTGEPFTKPFLFRTRSKAAVQRPALSNTNLTKRSADPPPPVNLRIIGGNGGSAPVNRAQFSPDGLLLVTASEETAQVWDVQTGRPLIEPLQHDGTVRSAQFSPDGLWMITASADKTARVWEVQTGKPVTEPLRHQGGVAFAQFSPDGLQIVTASDDKTARLWNALTGKPVADSVQHERAVYFAQFSPDGLRIVTASEDKTARVWDARTGKPVSEPLWHADYVVSVQFSPDGLRVVTASHDATARVWDAQTGRPITEPFRHGGIVFSAQFSRDGLRVVTASEDKTARVWETAFGSEPAPEWLPQLAVAVAGKRLTESAVFQPVATEEFLKLKERLNADPATSFYSRWVKWFLADRSTRTISPLSSITVSEYVQSRVEENTLESLRQAIELSPTNGLAFARLAMQTLTNDAKNNLRRFGEADFFSRRAIQLSPNDPKVQRIRAEIVEQIKIIKGH